MRRKYLRIRMRKALRGIYSRRTRRNIMRGARARWRKCGW